MFYWEKKYQRLDADSSELPVFPDPVDSSGLYLCTHTGHWWLHDLQPPLHSWAQVWPSTPDLLHSQTYSPVFLSAREHRSSYQPVSSSCSILRALGFNHSSFLGIKIPLHQALPGCESRLMSKSLFLWTCLPKCRIWMVTKIVYTYISQDISVPHDRNQAHPNLSKKGDLGFFGSSN